MERNNYSTINLIEDPSHEIYNSVFENTLTNEQMMKFTPPGKKYSSLYDFTKHIFIHALTEALNYFYRINH